MSLIGFIVASIFALNQPAVNVDKGIVTLDEVAFATPSATNKNSKQSFMNVAFPTISEDKLPVVIYIHGGGWEGGEKSEGKKMIELLAYGGYFAISIDYRLTQDGGYPNAVHDINAAIRFIRNNKDNLEIDDSRIGLVGYSAGGHLATLVGCSSDVTSLTGSINDQSVSSEVRCVGVINGVVLPEYMRGKGKQMYEAWIGSSNADSFKNSLPSTHLDSSDPPIYLISGEVDAICPLRRVRQFTNLLSQKNIEHELEVIPKTGHIITDPNAYLGLSVFLDSHLDGNAATVLRKYLQDSGTISKN